jgi:hypothetical protein
MSQPNTERNPFMLMLHPEAVLAAVEKSERLGALNRHLCRPLDRALPTQDADGEPAKSADLDFDA